MAATSAEGKRDRSATSCAAICRGQGNGEALATCQREGGRNLCRHTHLLSGLHCTASAHSHTSPYPKTPLAVPPCAAAHSANKSGQAHDEAMDGIVISSSLPHLF